uniref:Uncharacterized protein n=1 Tax=Noctiluca scintillans TaxID=2966 RepID=A0A7S1AKS6_NOCSC|mmetsp:Transcript_50448/g.134107  ORF Transcript_50448/g.134107 Transcript_50448/m.134107 type:complete len:769 (+) Transcript_50448:26-2332(+)
MAWAAAFECVLQGDFGLLNSLLQDPPDLEANLEWEGHFVTPVFVAVLLRLDDHLKRLLSLGADFRTHCIYDGVFCAPLHVAAVRGDTAVLRVLLDAECDPNAKAEGDVHGMPSRAGFAECNALHLLIIRDEFPEDIFRLLLRRGGTLSTPCQQDAVQISGLALPRHLGNTHATEERLDSVIGEEVRQVIHSPRSASALNRLLEVCSKLRQRHPETAYRLAWDVDFQLFSSTDSEEPTTALLLAADVGNLEATRLLLYAGANPEFTVPKVLSFSFSRSITVHARAVHLAVLRGHSEMLEQVFNCGLEATCHAEVRQIMATDILEEWNGLSLVHLAVLCSKPHVVPTLLGCRCNVDAPARCALAFSEYDAQVVEVSPLLLAVQRGDIACAAMLLDSGAVVNERVRGAALECESLCEMFGGPPVVGLEDWITALLTGEAALQRLIARRTDLSRPLDWPETTASVYLEQHRLVSPELVGRLVKTLEEVPTILRNLRPVHLACLFQLPWALAMLADEGVRVNESPPCHEVPRDLPLPEGLDAFPLDAVFLCVRVGGLSMLEQLRRGPFEIDVQREIPLAPDITPPFFPSGDSLTWAWRNLAPLEFALLHRRVDVAVLLVRLGADLLHRVDHVAVSPSEHYRVTDFCFRDLTPLHICTLFDNRTAASALLAACSSERHRQVLLSACCRQSFATASSEDEPWLWKDLTPLHLALLTKSYQVADVLVDASSPDVLALPCFQQDFEVDAERSMSALLIAFNRDLKELHRKISRKLPP